ncbi:recombinase family protein [Streptomyces sp. H10-C2]|uniref:recombinase family protein n=1 Tax=unclassified Streptomyces TaxID=2593676 RepID=UPI0024BAB68E|nr:MULTISPECIES: recombinase family protein [unclassified Streptomyces]MDJ0340784.1 recombinase family protein [Streptomyces sp. PH10-H1]MDJ0371624.1 recombinase family protein [Streptomyces sp. H10-C2]
MAIEESRKPRQAGALVRISDDPFETERGVTRQKEDIAELAARAGWQVSKIYEENDTSAYKRRRITLPDGRSVWRVIRPEFRQMLKDYEDGVIDGLIVYDLDRLARQPRDLEDLIDLVDHCKRPVIGVTGSLDLMTENGKAMARVLMAMANKSSADTARRVARERLQRAQDGRSKASRRAFGWKEDRVTVEPAEAAALKWAILRFTAGDSWSGIVKKLQDGDVLPPGGTKWYLGSLKNMMLSPKVAGIATYNGVLRQLAAPAQADQEGGEEGRTAAPSPKDRAVRDARGQYVKGPAQPVVTVEQWEALIDEYERRREGRDFTAHNTRRYLLSGLLRCGRPREDGTLCNKTLVGITTHRDGREMVVYKCPGRVNGGCGGTQRLMAKVDELIEDLLFLHLQTNRPDDDADQAPEPESNDPAAAELEDVRNRLDLMRTGMRDGTVTTETFFAVVPGLETREKKLTADLARSRRSQAARSRQLRTVEEVRAEWDAPTTTTAGHRALLGQYLSAVIVHPARHMGRGGFDHASIEPVWKPTP